MLSFPATLQVMMSLKPIDMRKAIDGLTLLVIEHLQHNPQEPSLFLFCNQQRNKIKGLYWDKNGFVLIYKRLERKKFYIPRSGEANKLEITHQQLSWLLAGFDFIGMAEHPDLDFKNYS